MKKIFDLNEQLAYILRAIRLSYESKEPLWKYFNEYILPFMIIVCLKIKQLKIQTI